jgi:hypothetical protein
MGVLYIEEGLGSLKRALASNKIIEKNVFHLIKSLIKLQAILKVNKNIIII